MGVLPAQPTQSHVDATLNFDRLQGILGLTGAKGQYLKLAVAGSHKVAFGKAELEWTVKSAESANLEVVTGLTTASFNFGQIANTFGYVTTLGVSGGTVTWRANANAELVAGTKRTLWWLAIE